MLPWIVLVWLACTPPSDENWVRSGPIGVPSSMQGGYDGNDENDTGEDTGGADTGGDDTGE